MESEALMEMATATYPEDYRDPVTTFTQIDRRADRRYRIALYPDRDVSLNMEDAHTYKTLETHHFVNVGGLAYLYTIRRRPEEWLDELRFQAKEQGAKEEA